MKPTDILETVCRATLLAALAALPLVAGCGEETPGGSRLMSPGQREASPVSEEALRMDRKERREEDLEASGLKPEEPGEEEGFDADLEPPS